MTNQPFDFEAFIAGTDLPRFEVPLYRVVHQQRINELNERIAETSVPDPKHGDLRESTIAPPDLTAERDSLVKAQDESAQWVELRTLSAAEFADVAYDKDKDALDQIAAQSKGTRNEGDRDKWAQVKASVLPGAWSLFLARANEIIEQTAVMPDFSLNSSATPSIRASSES